MIEKELILQGLQEQLRHTDDPNSRLIIQGIISDVLSGKYNVRIW